LKTKFAVSIRLIYIHIKL